MESKVKSVKAIAGVVKRLSNRPNNDLFPDEILRADAFDNSWDNYEDFVDFSDAYQDTHLA